MGKTYTADTPFKSAQQVLRNRAKRQDALDFSEDLTQLDQDVMEVNSRRPKTFKEVQREIEQSRGWLDK